MKKAIKIGGACMVAIVLAWVFQLQFYTTAGIIAPLLPVLGLASPARAALTVMAIGAGAMTVSHANDSYFWVVTNFGAMTPEKGYKTQTMCTLFLGLSAIVEIFILSLFIR